MVRLRLDKDGCLLAPQRGKPPTEVPKGYIRDINDPYRFCPKLKDCKYRDLQVIKRSCCSGDKIGLYCQLLDKFISRKDCLEC